MVFTNLGAAYGTLKSGVANQTALNVVYNVADLVNQIWFVLACWSCAKSIYEDWERNELSLQKLAMLRCYKIAVHAKL